MKEDIFKALVESEFSGKGSLDAVAMNAGVASIADKIQEMTGVQLNNGLIVTGWIDGDNHGVVVKMKIPAQRERYAHFVPFDVAAPAKASEQVPEASQEELDKQESERELAAKSKDAVGAALAKLDKTKDDDWTQAGEPRMDRVKELTGSTTLTKEELVTLFPDFKRPTE